MIGLKFHVVIPARFGSSRLPGKPLRTIAGKAMVVHVLERGRESGAQEVMVATDDERICSVVEAAGGVAIMTSPDHASGTDRLNEVATKQAWSDDTIIVNLQGDEPFVPGSLVCALATALEQHPEAGIATLATPIRDVRELFDPNVVKVVNQDDGLALYFSRAPIPWVRGVFEPGKAPAALPPSVPFLRHLGLYAYRVGTLRRLASAPAASLEEAESLEQLRALALGVRIHVTVVAQAPGHGIDTEDDLQAAEALLAASVAHQC